MLRSGGLLAFCATHPLVYLTWSDAKERQTRKLQIDYAELGRMDTGEGTIDWSVSPSYWIRLLREHGFDIEDLIELSPPEGTTTTYDQFVPVQMGTPLAGGGDLESTQALRARRRPATERRGTSP